MDKVRSEHQRNALRRALAGRLVVLCIGAGVDCTTVKMRVASLQSDLMAKTNGSGNKPAPFQRLMKALFS